jgi:hypothetical protein
LRLVSLIKIPLCGEGPGFQDCNESAAHFFFSPPSRYK